MKMHCKFCEKFAGQSSVAWGEATDQVLFESPNFVVVPSLGSILPGWLLIVPRNHFLCVGAMGDGLIHEMRQLRDEAAESLRSQIGPVTYFEHGPVKACTSVGCGIDHAHLHIV
jgi:diadenosine tetraphosphate (Ap4A) HIT family hydrolase